MAPLARDQCSTDNVSRKLTSAQLDPQGACHNVFGVNITQRSQLVVPGVMIYLFYPKFLYVVHLELLFRSGSTITRDQPRDLGVYDVIINVP